MVTVIIANIIDFIAAMVQIYSGAVKEKKKILAAQSAQIGIQTVSMLLLGGVTGAINNVLSVIRNVICYKDKMNWPVKVILIAASGIMTILFNTQGALGWVPFGVCAVYILFMDIKDPIRFKILVTGTFFPWVIYFFLLKSYTGAFFAAATIVTNMISLVQMIRAKRQQGSNAESGTCAH